MNCPHCQQQVLPDGTTCRHCDFDLTTAEKAYGKKLVLLPVICDLANCLSRTDHESLAKTIRTCSRQIAPFFVRVCLVELPQQTSIQEFGFWLINHAKVDPDSKTSYEDAVLLIIDPRSKKVGFSLGYRVEAFLDRARMESILMKARNAFAEAEWSLGAQIVLSKVTRILAREVAKAAPRPNAHGNSPRRFRRPTVFALKFSSLFSPS